jgi:hypothetical protein
VSCSSAEANKIHLLSSWQLTPPSPCKFEKALSNDPIKAVSQIFVSMFSMGMQELFKLCNPMDFSTMVASRKMCVQKFFITKLPHYVEHLMMYVKLIQYRLAA